jgi:hypothetical protein
MEHEEKLTRTFSVRISEELYQAFTARLREDRHYINEQVRRLLKNSLLPKKARLLDVPRDTAHTNPLF